MHNFLWRATTLGFVSFFFSIYDFWTFMNVFVLKFIILCIWDKNIFFLWNSEVFAIVSPFFFCDWNYGLSSSIHFWCINVVFVECIVFTFCFWVLICEICGILRSYLFCYPIFFCGSMRLSLIFIPNFVCSVREIRF